MKQIVINPDQFPKLVLIEYPAIVKNESRAIDCLGGMDSINQVMERPNVRRFEFRFRPEDKYCKPSCSESKPGFGFLLRLKVRRYKNSSRAPQVLSSQPVGMIKQIFSFDALFDFQYLPLDNDGNNIYHQMVPGSILDVEYFSRPTTAFVPPITLSRIDKPQFYCYRRPPVKRCDTSVLRNRRKIGSYSVSHLVEEVPAASNAAIANQLEPVVNQLNLTAARATLEQMFAERPVMSRMYLMHNSGISSDRLKLLLPLIAYNFVSGPWRTMWAKLGYDPRQDPDAWRYQIVDYRARGTALKTKMKIRRPVATAPYRVKKKELSLIGDTNETENTQKETLPDDNMFRFRPGYFPGAMQIFYQYCDVELPEVAETLQSNVQSKYNSESGWLAPSVETTVRSLIKSYVDSSLRDLDDSRLEDSTLEQNDVEDMSVEDPSAEVAESEDEEVVSEGSVGAGIMDDFLDIIGEDEVDE